MNANNLYIRLRELQPDQPLLTGSIVADLGYGIARVQLGNGGYLAVRNPLKIAAGSNVYVQGDAITGEAPTLPYVLIEI